MLNHCVFKAKRDFFDYGKSWVMGIGCEIGVETEEMKHDLNHDLWYFKL